MGMEQESALEHLWAESLYGTDDQRRRESKVAYIALRTRVEGAAHKPKHNYVRVNAAARHALTRLKR